VLSKERIFSIHSPFPKIVVVTSTFPRWADDSEPAFVFELSRRLSVSFDITVLVPRSPGCKAQDTMAGMRVIRFPYFFKRWENLATHSGGILSRLRANRLNYLLVPFFLMGQFLTLFRLLRKERFDLIHAHWIIPQGLSVIMVRTLLRNKTPVICTSHGGDLFALRGRLFHWLKQQVINSCDLLTVVSNAMRNTVLDMGVAPEKVKVISMGVDLAHFYTLDPAIDRSNNELLFVGRLVEKKGLDVLLKAMPQVIKVYPDAYLTIAGAGPMEGQLKNIVREKNLTGKVAFLGMRPQSELPLLYRRAAIAVFPFVVAESGDQEGLGLVVIEAMGCGCPVIASDLPAIHDSIIHEKNGLMVSAGSPESLALAITKLLSDAELRLQLSSRARNSVVDKFDWQQIAYRYSRLYRKVLVSRKPLIAG